MSTLRGFAGHVLARNDIQGFDQCQERARPQYIATELGGFPKRWITTESKSENQQNLSKRSCTDCHGNYYLISHSSRHYKRNKDLQINAVSIQHLGKPKLKIKNVVDQIISSDLFAII